MEEEVCTDVDVNIQDETDAQMLLLCRLCANESEKYLGIFDEEGVANDLPTKINLYLPIKVSENDALPSQCCWSCATTLIAWHELVLASIDADKRLRELQMQCDKRPLEIDDKCEDFEDADPEPESLSDPEADPDESNEPEPATSEDQKPEALAEPRAASLNTFYQKASSAKKSTHKKKSTDIIKDLWLENPKTDSVKDSLQIVKLEPLVPVIRKTAKRAVKKSAVIKTVDIKKEEQVKIEDDALLDHVPMVVRSEDDPEVYQFVCQYCSTLHESEEDILQHIKKDHPQSQKRGAKKDRRKNTKIDQDAVNAAKVVVDDRVYYNCKICAKSLHSPYTYIWHMRIHTGERPFVCDLCGKQFRVSQGLVRHLKETHEGIKNFPCDLCGRMFATRRNVEEHRRIHTNERPYICDLCGKSFKQKASLFVHNRSHSTLFPYHCSYCNQGFRTRPPLLIHMTRHTGEKPYPCDVCGRCFRIKYELKRHMLIHSDIKPFACHQCGLCFRQKRYLRNHNKINHTADPLS